MAPITLHASLTYRENTPSNPRVNHVVKKLLIPHLYRDCFIREHYTSDYVRTQNSE
jgi:hypothetical protein